ncbi:ABC transporter permease [Pseudonocardia sp. WMMC193]|uniref:ABC transporter permease n=1 Tax=Pseudonocardia sp. WMMC193 TaxID=2911965 RepID=UPI001F20D00A|nr:ABC transporter permease [Pseudonocardia sp. WMMC193]MCF7549998.1 ABC transporter permease [Pseudonocardia sp. WMMC193]
MSAPTAAPRPSVARPLLSRRTAALVPLALVVLVAVVGPFVVPFDPERVIGPVSQPPGAPYLFGTDSAGLDVFSRTIAAARTNLLIALGTTVGATLIGLVLGLTIGMSESGRGARAAVARGSARIVDLVEAVPAVLAGLIVVSFYGATGLTLTVAMSVILCPVQVRLVRTEVLRVRGEAYLDAARMQDMSEWELTLRHVLPNASRPALQNTSVIFAVSVILTAALGFIGVGLPPPTPEWGSMLTRGVSDALTGRWWSAAFPAAALAATVASVSLASRTFFERPTR